MPGIGPKLAERLVLSIFKSDQEHAEAFSHALLSLHNVRTCTECFNITEESLCLICSNDSRDRSLLCIVEDPLDILPIERAKTYSGLYHVLGGTVDGRKNDHLKIHALEQRIQLGHISEVIIATNFTTEGDMTAQFLLRRLSQQLTNQGITLSRIVRGLATGSDIEYADDLTLKSALSNRTKVL